MLLRVRKKIPAAKFGTKVSSVLKTASKLQGRRFLGCVKISFGFPTKFV